MLCFATGLDEEFHSTVNAHVRSLVATVSIPPETDALHVSTDHSPQAKHVHIEEDNLNFLLRAQVKAPAADVSEFDTYLQASSSCISGSGLAWWKQHAPDNPKRRAAQTGRL